MKRIIVDYAKLTNEILNLLVEKFPEGYEESDIIRFKNIKNEMVEAVEVRTNDTIYLVKVSTKLSDRIVNYDEEIDIVEPITNIDLDEDISDDEEEHEDKPEFDDDDDDSHDNNDDYTDDQDDDDDDDK